MRTIRLAVWCSLFTCIFGNKLQAAEIDCSQILKWGIFNEETVGSLSDVRNSLHDFYCTHEFSSLEDFTDLGIGITIPLAEIPIPIGADQNFSKEKYEIQKKDACRNFRSSSSSLKTLNSLKTKVATPIIEAWSSCVAAVKKESDATANKLLCRFIRGDESHVFLQVGRLDSSEYPVKLNGDPVVTGVQGKLPNGLPKDTMEFPRAARIIVFERAREGGDAPRVTVDISTTAGACSAEFPPFEDVHSGELILSSQDFGTDTVIRAGKLVIMENSKIRIHHGKRLKIEAHEIYVGTNVEIDATGDSGENGKTVIAKKHVKACIGTNNPPDYPTNCCEVEKRGQCEKACGCCNGEDGGVGGRGGDVELVADKKLSGSAKIKTTGGPGGTGSNGDPDYKMECWAPGGPLSWSCQCKVTHGKQGAAGQDGAVVQQVRKLNHYISSAIQP